MANKTKYRYHNSYLGNSYESRPKGNGWNGSSLEFSLYKGHIVLTVKTRGLEANAWLWGEDFDTLITEIKAAKKIWLREWRHMDVVSKCKDCAKTYSVCAAHKKFLLPKKKR